jgi:hypothetical protein
VKHLFEHINDNLAKREQGVIGYTGFGQFRIAKLENGREESRIRFRPAKDR